MAKFLYLLISNSIAGGTGDNILSVCTSKKMAKIAYKKAIESGTYCEDQDDLDLLDINSDKPNLIIIKRQMNTIIE